MFNITSDVHVDLYYQTNNSQKQNYDYILGNLDKLPSKVIEEIMSNVDEYIDIMMRETKEITDTLILAGDIANNNSYSKVFLKKDYEIGRASCRERV